MSNDIYYYLTLTLFNKLQLCKLPALINGNLKRSIAHFPQIKLKINKLLNSLKITDMIYSEPLQSFRENIWIFFSFSVSSITIWILNYTYLIQDMQLKNFNISRVDSLFHNMKNHLCEGLSCTPKYIQIFKNVGQEKLQPPKKL